METSAHSHCHTCGKPMPCQCNHSASWLPIAIGALIILVISGIAYASWWDNLGAHKQSLLDRKQQTTTDFYQLYPTGSDACLNLYLDFSTGQASRNAAICELDQRIHTLEQQLETQLPRERPGQ